MLYQRILTAIPLAAFVFWIIFFQPSSVFLYFVLFIVLISGYEWARLSGVKNTVVRCVYSAVMAGVTFIIFEYVPDLVNWIIYLSVVWWFGISYYLLRAIPKDAHAGFKLDTLSFAFIVLPAAALAMQQVHAMPQGADWLFYALSLVWVADIGAYFSGKKFGNNKLAPNISPGKTKEGLAGAIIATSLYTLIVCFYFGLNVEKSVLLLVMSVVLTFISVSGDLYISFLKREAGLKDSGNILPGHGGILDRIDSVLAAMPVFLVGYNFLIVSN